MHNNAQYIGCYEWTSSPTAAVMGFLNIIKYAKSMGCPLTCAPAFPFLFAPWGPVVLSRTQGPLRLRWVRSSSTPPPPVLCSAFFLCVSSCCSCRFVRWRRVAWVFAPFLSSTPRLLSSLVGSLAWPFSLLVSIGTLPVFSCIRRESRNEESLGCLLRACSPRIYRAPFLCRDSRAGESWVVGLILVRLVNTGTYHVPGFLDLIIPMAYCSSI